MNTIRSADGTTIALDHVGDGPPLALVVGAFCDRTAKDSLAAGLGDRFTVYRYDRRGRGDSGNNGASGVQGEIEDLAAVIAAIDGDALVFGDSSGGALAIEAAAADVPIRGLAVYEVPYTDGPTLAVADELAELVASDRSSDAVERFLAMMGTPPEAIAHMKSGTHWSHMEAFAPTLPYDVRLCNDGTVPGDRLGKIATPLLALAGDQSLWAIPAAHEIAAAAANGRAQILPAQGHAVDDAALIPTLTEFFESV
jgi:pimeloyl-ACP methyl ester carboxylesterase